MTNTGNKGCWPQRTCIVCGRKRAKPALLRLVLDAEGRVCLDRHQRRQGRGAYVCLVPECLTRLKLTRLQKAFRRPLPEGAWSDALPMFEALQGCGPSYQEKRHQPLA